MFMAPHFVRDYRRMVRKLASTYAKDEAMERAVGGAYVSVGQAQAALLKEIGLGEGDYLVDVGCGSGRTAFALRDMAALRYQGTDVVQELLDYAREKVARPDWRFTLVEGLTIPEADGQADMIAMFSVLTHLTTGEARTYLTDARRVLKPEGKIVASFLDTSLDVHRKYIAPWYYHIINLIRAETVHNKTHTVGEIEALAASVNLRPQFIGNRVGQSVVVLTTR
jgi:ubiquinone/menaquinone biosynthesis C-methylase UbiE